VYFVYILYSFELDRYYIGSAENVELRLKKHLSNHDGFTSKAKDWQIKYIEKFSDKKLAQRRERQLKNRKSRKMLEALIVNKR